MDSYQTDVIDHRRVYFVLDPKLGDGQHWSVVDDVDSILESVREWLADNANYPDRSFTIKTKLMSDAEVDHLPSL
jgi:hypothetical protein